MKISVLFSVVAALSLTIPAHGEKAQNQSAASPQAVCAYIVGRMTTALPKQPTLCSGNQERTSGRYFINIFSPNNVLEGDTRRAWSSALFQTLEDLAEEKSLDGACSTTPDCAVTIADAYMSQHNLRYKTFLDKVGVSFLRGGSPSAPAEFSEHWYVAWWQRLFTLKESDNPGSKENATQLGKRACEDYIAASRKRDSAEFARRQEDRLTKEGGTLLGTVELGHPTKSELPSCSVMLATDKRIYIAVDFADLMNALFGASRQEELPPTFGSWFDSTGYDGQVIIRSPWTDNGGQALRVYYIFPLRAIEFAYEEKESGLRDEFGVGELLRTDFEVPGQVCEDTFECSTSANAVVVRYATEPDETVIVDMTDGAEWKISKESFDRCSLGLGVEVNVSTLLVTGSTASLNGPPVLSTQRDAVYCKLTATFVKGW